MGNYKPDEYCRICGYRVDSFGAEIHAEWCPRGMALKNVRIKSTKQVTVNEIVSASMCFIDNDKGIVVFYE